MANDLTANPWIIDTASATNLTADRVRVRSIRWVGATTAAHKATVQNGVGRTVWDSVDQVGVNSIEQSRQGGYMEQGLNIDGLRVPTIDSGKLYIELA